MRQSAARANRRRLLPGLIPMVVLGATIWAVALAATPAFAFNAPATQTVLSLSAPQTVSAGSPVSATVQLRDSAGNPLWGQAIALSVNGAPAGWARTGLNGSAGLAIPGWTLANPGAYKLGASFAGNANLQPATAGATLNVVPTPGTPGGAGVASSALTAPPRPFPGRFGQPPIATSVPTTAASALGSVATPGSGGVGQSGGLAGVVTLNTRLAVEVPTGSVLGSDVTVTAILTTTTGIVLPDEHVALSLDGSVIRSDRTDATGKVSLVIPARDLPAAGDYTVDVAFGGAHGLNPTDASVKLSILAAAIQIQSVPALAGLRFTLGSETAITGPDGVAALPVPKTGTYQLSADLNPQTADAGNVRASFVRWLDNIYTANRTIDVTGPATYYMGLRVAVRATIQYVDLDNKPVDPSIVQQAQFSNGSGANDVVLNPQTSSSDVWWTSANAVRYGSDLTVSNTIYRAISVKIHGAEVVNRGQQAWSPIENGVWTIQLLLYSMTVQTSDAMFGSPLGGNLRLTYPDGTYVEQPVGAEGKTTFASLPRGQYQLSLRGSGISLPTPVALSKAQDVTLRVISYVDVGLAFGGLALIFALLLGRWVVVSRRIRRRQRAEDPAIGATT